MAVTYDDELATDRDRVRFNLHDTVSGSGPQPDSGNFTDNEIAGIISLEGSWQKAVASGFEVLAAAWRRYTDTQVGPRREMYHLIANGYAKDAERWRDRYGDTGGGTFSSAWVTRVDAYSDDISAGET